MPRGVKKKKSIVKEKKVKVSERHPLSPAIDFITENMGPVPANYWAREANKKKITLRLIIAKYIIGDMGLEKVVKPEDL